jgi:hypothetical protein
MRPFLVVGIACLVLFVVASFYVGGWVPTFWRAPPPAATRGLEPSSMWPLVQNLSALVGIVSFLIQISQWGRNR